MRVAFEWEERSPGPQKLELPETPPDVKSMTLESHEGHGTGRATIDFGRFAARGEQKCERRGLVKVEMRGQTLSMRKAFRLQYTFGPN
jgi:hypothetical protein